MINPNEVYERYRIAGIAWAEAEGVANRLEEMRKIKKAQIMLSFNEKTVSKAEMLAEADSVYIAHIENMVEARTKANIAKAEFDAIKSWIDITRTLESSRRAEMNIR